MGNLAHAKYSVIPAKMRPAFRVIENKENLPVQNYIGVLGMPGQTAVYGWKEYAQAKKGETAFVTSASGAVGSLVCQLAKADGMRVIASAGSDKKVEYLKTLGVDVAFNCKLFLSLSPPLRSGPNLSFQRQNDRYKRDFGQGAPH